MAELFTSVDGIRDTKKQLAQVDEAAAAGTSSILFATGSNRVIPQPKGVVGIVVAVELPALPHHRARSPASSPPATAR